MPSPLGPLLNHLPAIYHTSKDLQALLSIFEAVLFGTDGRGPSGQRRLSLDEIMPLEDAIASIASLFDAYETPKEFIPWLAQWVALTHLSGLTEERQRQLVARIVPLYARRGTKNYLAELVTLFTPDNTTVSIEDQELQGFIIGTAKIGLDTRLAPDRPFWFEVKILLPAPSDDPEERRAFRAQWEQRIRRIVDLSKPAHTLYELDCQFEASA
jgi:phage tail-like protein